jgi:DNA-binding NarL/FixJ family response regulator
MSHKEEDTSMPRDTRLLYVENDPVLRSMMTVLLAGLDGIEVAASVSDSTEALASEERFDVALLDWALGPNSLNGVQLGRALRERDENVGIVILSQHYAWDFHGGSGRVSMGWSYVEKRADIDTAYLTKVLKATASGLSVVEPAMDQGQAPESAERLGRLSVRQRQIMSLAATGVDANVIAEQIGLAAVTVRKELSECYRILVPDPAPGTDLRTAAVVAWIEGRRVTSMDAYDN